MPCLPGQLRRHQHLGTTATYRVVAIDGDLVRVAVVESPGLLPGQVFRFTRAAAEAMELLPEPVRETVEDVVAAWAAEASA
jgi:hypothetical protein